MWSNFYLKKKAAKLVATVTVTGLLVSSVSWLGENQIFFAVIFGMFLWAISDAEKVLNKIKSSKNKLLFWLLEPWLILGTMSYSVYLLHGKVFVFPNILVRQIFDYLDILYGLFTKLSTLILYYQFHLFVKKIFLSKNYKVIQQKILIS